MKNLWSFFGDRILVAGIFVALIQLQTLLTRLSSG